MQESAYWLAWSQVSRVGPIILRRLQEYFGTLEVAWHSTDQDLRQIEGVGKVLLQAIKTTRSQLNPLEFYETHSIKNPNFWTPADPDYPRLLLEIPSPPPVLYYQGQPDKQENQGLTPLVGIVGTRHPSEYGQRWTSKISAALTRHGFTVVSGMAAGIDTTAHRSCLQAGGRTLAVLGTGVDVVYPRSNRQLYQDIQLQGLVLSEYPAGTKPEAKHFPPRNRIIAGLCRAVLVMEAAQRSGALITARYGNEFGRDVYTLPGSLDNPKSRGCLEWLHQGAEMILGESEILKMLGTIPQLDSVASSPPQSQAKINLEPELAQIFEVITPEGTPFDAIVQQTNLAASSVSSGLLQLELLDLVTQLPGMRYCNK